MDIRKSVRKKRALLMQACAISIAFAVGAAVSTSAPIAADPAAAAAAAARLAADPASLDDPAATKLAKVPLANVDITKTYVNPIDLPGMAVRNIVGTMPATDANVANASQIQASLNLPTWTAATGRTLASRASQGFTRISENSARTGADWSALDVDGTMYLYASGAMQSAPNNDRTVWSTTDYLTWTPHQMNLGVTAPTVVQIGAKFYMAGNNSAVYQSDSPVGPWTSMGNFLRKTGQTLSVGDVQFFLDTDGRLYLTYNIGSPIMGLELDPANPRQAISDPVVMWTFDPLQEWQHIGDNKATYTHGYVEGSQLFKVDDTYYLSVASGGTEFTVYNTGVMSSDKPLSGFTYTQQNPIGVGDNHPSSVYPNAGHGSFVEDASGNLIFFYTYDIGYEEFFERRLGMDMCAVSAEGAIGCELSNTPRLAPGQPRSEAEDIGLYNVATNSQLYWTSSYSPGRNPYYGSDRLLGTWWEPAEGDAAPTYIRGFGTVFNISSAQIQWKELGRTFTKDNAVKYRLEYKDIATNTWLPLVDKSTTTTPHTAEYVTFDTVLTNAVRLKILGTTENVKVGVAELGVFGENYTLALSKGLVAAPPTAQVSSVSIAPSSATVIKGETKAFTATVTAVGGASQAVTWSVTGASSAGTTVSNAGLLTVAADETATSLTVTATSDFDTAKSAAATVTLKAGFTDVPPGSQFKDEIIWAAELGLINGYADGTFRPAAPVDRQSAAAILYRFTHPGATTPPTCAAAPFTDVPTTSAFCGAIDWMKSAGISTGNGDGTFSPNSVVSRQSIAAFLYRLDNSGTDPACTAKPFTDVSVTSQFCGEIAWLASTGISGGFADGTFRPGAAVARGALVAFLYRSQEN